MATGGGGEEGEEVRVDTRVSVGPLGDEDFDGDVLGGNDGDESIEELTPP